MCPSPSVSLGTSASSRQPRKARRAGRDASPLPTLAADSFSAVGISAQKVSICTQWDLVDHLQKPRLNLRTMCKTLKPEHEDPFPSAWPRGPCSSVASLQAAFGAPGTRRREWSPAGPWGRGKPKRTRVDVGVVPLVHLDCGTSLFLFCFRLCELVFLLLRCNLGRDFKFASIATRFVVGYHSLRCCSWSV